MTRLPKSHLLLSKKYLTLDDVLRRHKTMIIRYKQHLSEVKSMPSLRNYNWHVKFKCRNIIALYKGGTTGYLIKFYPSMGFSKDIENIFGKRVIVDLDNDFIEFPEEFSSLFNMTCEYGKLYI